MQISLIDPWGPFNNSMRLVIKDIEYMYARSEYLQFIVLFLTTWRQMQMQNCQCQECEKL